MKTATYRTSDGPLVVEYDETYPCIICGLPVVEASVGGTAICPWCDCGYYRDGEKWAYADATSPELVKAKAKLKEGLRTKRA